MANNSRLRRQQKNTVNIKNQDSPLYKKLTKIFSGPIVNYRSRMITKNRKKEIDKYANKFQSLSGQKYARNMYTPFDYIRTSVMATQNRQERYVDFEQMEFDPLLASALDMYADSITTHTEINPILKIECSNDEIKNILKTFFYDVLNIDINGFFWARNLCKFGEFFLYQDVDETLGIKSVIALPTIEVERLEGEDEDNPNYVQFRWNSGGLTFENWQVAHFRILGNEKYAPYGTSVLDPARRLWRQLCHAKGTKVWVKDSGFKTIEEVLPGDIVLSFDSEKQETKETRVKYCINMGEQEVCKLQTAHRIIEVTPNHGILIKDKNGNFLYKKAEDIIISNGEGGQKYRNADKLVVPNSWKNEKDSVEFELDSSLYEGRSKAIKNNLKGNFKTTPEFLRLFGFMFGDGWLRDCGLGFALGIDLKQNDFYVNLFKTIFNLDAHVVESRENRGGQALFSSKEVETLFKQIGFHSGFNNKSIPDWIFSLNQENKVNFLRGLHDADGCEKDRRITLSNKKLIEQVRILCQQSGVAVGREIKLDRKAGKYEDSCFGEITRTQDSYRLFVNLDDIDTSDFSLEAVTQRIYENKVVETYDLEVDDDTHNFCAEGIISHNTMMVDSMMAYRVTRSSEKLIFKVPVGGINEEEIPGHMEAFISSTKRHQIVDPDTGKIDQRFNPVSVEENYYFPTVGGEGPDVTTLPGGNNLTAIDDIKYLKNLMFAAIKIPEAYLGGGEHTEDQTTLTQKDIHFATTIQRIQGAMISTLEEMARVHLYVLGFRGDDLLSYTLKFNNPSRIARMQELETFKQQLEAAGTAKNYGKFSDRYIYQNIFGLSEDDCKRIERERFYDKQLEAAIEASVQDMAGEGMEGAMGGEGAMPMGGDITGDMGGLTSEPTEEPDMTAPEDKETVDKEAPLLATPDNIPTQGVKQTVERDDEGNIVKIHIGTNQTMTPKSKGKVYTPVASDTRKTAGPLKRSMNYQGGSNLASSAARNLNPGASSLKRIAKLQESINMNSKNQTIYSELNAVFNSLEAQLEKLNDEAKT